VSQDNRAATSAGGGDLDWLGAAHLQAEKREHGLTRAEAACFRHTDELVFGISALDQHAVEDPPGHPGIEAAATAVLQVSIELIERDVLAKIRDQSFTSRAENAVHFVERLDGLGEILESSGAINEIKGIAGKGQGRGVAEPEVDAHACFAGIVLGNFDKGPADIEPGNLEISELCEFDGEKSRAGSDFEHAGTTGQSLRHNLGLAAEIVRIVAPRTRIPSGHPTLHSRSLEGFLICDRHSLLLWSGMVTSRERRPIERQQRAACS